MRYTWKMPGRELLAFLEFHNLSNRQHYDALKPSNLVYLLDAGRNSVPPAGCLYKTYAQHHTVHALSYTRTGRPELFTSVPYRGS